MIDETGVKIKAGDTVQINERYQSWLGVVVEIMPEWSAFDFAVKPLHLEHKGIRHFSNNPKFIQKATQEMIDYALSDMKMFGTKTFGNGTFSPVANFINKAAKKGIADLDGGNDD